MIPVVLTDLKLKNQSKYFSTTLVNSDAAARDGLLEHFGFCSQEPGVSICAVIQQNGLKTPQQFMSKPHFFMFAMKNNAH